MSNPKLTRIPSMRERVEDTLSAHRNELISLLSRFILLFSAYSVLFPKNVGKDALFIFLAFSDFVKKDEITMLLITAFTSPLVRLFLFFSFSVLASFFSSFLGSPTEC